MLRKSLTIIALIALTSQGLFAGSDTSSSEIREEPVKNSDQPAKVAIVNFKLCVEKSKMGKKEQETFEAMKKQMETILGDKEKELTALANKLADSDYLDSLSPEKETDMKRQFRAQSQELQQTQNQYLQTLQQANVKIIQKLAEVVAKAAAIVAEEKAIDLVLNEDVSFFHGNKLDISDAVTSIMDDFFDKEISAAKETKPETLGANTAD